MAVLLKGREEDEWESGGQKAVLTISVTYKQKDWKQNCKMLILVE